MEKPPDPQTRSESKTRLVEQINLCLRSGDYSRSLDLLRAASAEFPSDAELSELEKRAQIGIQRNAEANRLITESQGLFAQRKSAEAIQRLRQAYELDTSNSLSRTILANALVEHAHSLVEANWLEAETLLKQALDLNPAHPTAKTILSLIVEQKKASSVDDWVSRARKLHSSGDLFAALAWVAEGLAVHPDDSKLLQIHDTIQRDQSTRRRQARRQDLEDLRRMELEIDGAADSPQKQALAERIQGVAAKYWTDGEFLSVANELLNRLGLAPRESASPHSKGTPVIFHVPRPSSPNASRSETSPVSSSADTPIQVSPSEVSPKPVAAAPAGISPSEAPASVAPPAQVATTPSELQVGAKQAAPVRADAPPAKPPFLPSEQEHLIKWNSTSLMLASTIAAVILVAAIFLFTRTHAVPSATKSSIPASPPAVSTTPRASPEPTMSAPAPTPTQTTPEPLPVSSGTDTGKIAFDSQPPADSGHNQGTLLVVTGQDNARVFLNGKPQSELTQAGQLRLPNLEVKEYVVQVSKNGFQDSPSQKIRIRRGEEARLIFNLQPQPRPASLTIQGGVPGTAVLVDQAPVGTIQPDGTLSFLSVSPGEHTVELRKERFKARQFKKQFVAGGTISLTAPDAALEPAPGELKITFVPPDANVAIVKGELLKIVSSGVPINLSPGKYTLTARTADGFTSSSALDVIAGQSRALSLSLVPTGMSNWEDLGGGWKREKDSFTRKGGDFVLYGVAPASGTFVFSAMITKGRLLQWVLNYVDSNNYVLCQMDDNNFYRTVVRNGEKTDAVRVPDKGEKKTFRTLHIRVSATELVHQIKHGDSWTIVDRWTQPGANLSQGKFGFYIPGDDQLAVSSFAHYADLNIR